MTRKDLAIYGKLREHGHHLFSFMADKKFFSDTYEDMTKEKAARKEYAASRKKVLS